jgi:hypothetical protein
MSLIRHCNFRRNKYDQERSRTFLEYEDRTTEILRTWNVTAKVIPVKIGDNWRHIEIIQKIPEQHT